MENERHPNDAIIHAIGEAADEDGIVPMETFARTALYHETFGYYRREKNRVGRNREADFQTASNYPDILADALIEASANRLEASGIDPSEVSWIEIGAEPNTCILDGKSHPFRNATTLRIGDTIAIEGKAVVFSNELFDAQPFVSARFRQGRWMEVAIRITGDGALEETERDPFSESLIERIGALPKSATEGYRIDLPTEAHFLAERILGSSRWTGLFIAFDYGKTWKALTEDTPQGTARSYRKHRQRPNILENPGEQDITTHICWDWIHKSLETNGFSDIELESQESFIIKRAPDLLKRVLDPSNHALSKQRGQLKQLIHPALMGQKFQAISGLRLPGS